MKKQLQPRRQKQQISKEGVSLGDKVKDKISGIQGVVIGISHWLNGCDTIGIRPRAGKDNKEVDCLWVDDIQVEVLHEGFFFEKEKKTGGPQPIPQRQVKGE
jgi:hypothetical protein